MAVELTYPEVHDRVEAVLLQLVCEGRADFRGVGRRGPTYSNVRTGICVGPSGSCRACRPEHPVAVHAEGGHGPTDDAESSLRFESTVSLGTDRALLRLMEAARPGDMPLPVERDTMRQKDSHPLAPRRVRPKATRPPRAEILTFESAPAAPMESPPSERGGLRAV